MAGWGNIYGGKESRTWIRERALQPASRERSEKTHTECSEQQTRRIIKIDPNAYRGLLRNRDFRLLWLAQIQTAIGDWIIVAVLFAFVDKLSGGKSYGITLMMLAKFLPAVLLGFLAGVFIDHFDRKTTLMISDIARALLYVILPFSTRSGTLASLAGP